MTHQNIACMDIQLLPSPTDFEAYARFVQKWPMLSAGEEARLIKAWHEEGDRLAARDLVTSHLRLVVRVVRAHRGYGLSSGDLAQEGTVGLMRAVQKFNPLVGVRLAAYALRWIEAEIREFIFKNWRMVRLGGTAAMKKLFFGYRQTVASLKKMDADRKVGVTAAEVARAMGLTAEQVDQARQYFDGRDTALESPRFEDSEAPSDALMLEALPSGENHAEAYEEEDRQAAITSVVRQALNRLPERDRAVVIARQLTVPPVGLVDLGKQWGISAERVRQVEKRASQRLLENLKENRAHQLL